MPLDGSIFFQGAAMQNQNARDLQNSLAGAVGAYGDYKKKQGEAPDLEKAAQEFVYRSQAGLPIPDDIRAAAQAYDTLRSTEQMAGPYNEPIAKYKSLFGGAIPAGTGYQSTMMPDTAMQEPAITYDAPPAGGAMPNISAPKRGSSDTMDQFNLVPMSEQQAADLLSGKIDPQDPALMGGGSKNNVGGILRQQSGIGNTALGRTEDYKAGTELVKKEEELALSAGGKQAEAYAAETGKNLAELEAKVKGLKELNAGFSELLAASEGTASGVIEGAGVKLSEWVGKPSQKALKTSAFESKAALSGLVTRIEFLKGQGTVSDAEAKQVLSMLPDSWDPVDTKKAKIKAAQDYMLGVIAGKEGNAPNVSKNSAFKYLGVKQ